MEGKGVQGMWYIYQLVICHIMGWGGGGGGEGGGVVLVVGDLLCNLSRISL